MSPRPICWLIDDALERTVAARAPYLQVARLSGNNLVERDDLEDVGAPVSIDVTRQEVFLDSQRLIGACGIWIEVSKLISISGRKSYTKDLKAQGIVVLPAMQYKNVIPAIAVHVSDSVPRG